MGAPVPKFQKMGGGCKKNFLGHLCGRECENTKKVTFLTTSYVSLHECLATEIMRTLGLEVGSTRQISKRLSGWCVFFFAKNAQSFWQGFFLDQRKGREKNILGERCFCVGVCVLRFFFKKKKRNHIYIHIYIYTSLSIIYIYLSRKHVFCIFWETHTAQTHKREKKTEKKISRATLLSLYGPFSLSCWPLLVFSEGWLFGRGRGKKKKRREESQLRQFFFNFFWTKKVSGVVCVSFFHMRGNVFLKKKHFFG